MLRVGAQDESEATWSIREKLLLAQAVHQVQSKESAETTIDWTQVTGLLKEFVRSKKIEAFDFSFDDRTVCSDAYAKLCETYLQDQDKQAPDGSQALTVTRQLYEAYIKSIAGALLEEEKKCERIQRDIEAIARGEWDDKLKAAEEQSQHQPQAVSDQPEASNHDPVGIVVDAKNLPDPPTSTGSGVPTAGIEAKTSPHRQDREDTVTAKEVQQEKSNTQEIPSNNEKQKTRGRKRKAPPEGVSAANEKVHIKPPTADVEKQSVKSPTSRSRAPQVPKSSSSENEDDDDDDDATVEQFIKATEDPVNSPTKHGLRSRANRKNERQPSVPHDSKKESSRSKLPQSKKVKLQEGEVSSPRDAEITGKSPAAQCSPPPKEDSEVVIQEKPERESGETANSPSPNKLPAASESPPHGNSTTHSPGSAKKPTLENEVSADGSHLGTPNSATFGIGNTEGNLTANQTPNSTKLGLYPVATTDTSSATSARGAGSTAAINSTTNDPTSFRRRMLKTHSSVQSNPVSSIFRDPVKESEAPGYYSIIKRPMDLRTLAKKLRDGKVVSTEEYRRDLMLMLANAVMFNHEDSEVTRHAKELMVECDRLVSIFMRGSRY